jgi:hypothetical protein
MKFTWNQQTLRPALEGRPVEQTAAAELSEIQRAQAVRARANRLYVLGEMALAAQLLLELEEQHCWA